MGEPGVMGVYLTEEPELATGYNSKLKSTDPTMAIMVCEVMISGIPPHFSMSKSKYGTP